MSKEPPPEFRKFADDSVLYRELEETVGRLRLAMFVAALGPIAIGFFYATKMLPVGRSLALAVLGTPVAAIILCLLSYLRSPKQARASKQAIRIVATTIVLAVSTYVLSGYFGLLASK